LGRNKLVTQHEVTFAAGEHPGALDEGRLDNERRRESVLRDLDSPMKSVRFGKNSQESIATSENI
jgi:hypothetical protein